MKNKKSKMKYHKIFADITISVKYSKGPTILGVSYKISREDIKFVSDYKINHGSNCKINFNESIIEQEFLSGEITFSRTIDSGYGINKYTLEFNNPLSEEDLYKITHIYNLK